MNYRQEYEKWVSSPAITDEELQPAVLKKLAVASMDDLYASIDYGGMTATKAVNKIAMFFCTFCLWTPNEKIKDRHKNSNH